MSPPGTDPETPPPESPHPKTRPGGTHKKEVIKKTGEGRRQARCRKVRGGHSSFGGLAWEDRDNNWAGHESGDIPLPQHLGPEMQRLDIAGGRGPSGRRAQNAGRSQLGELFWRLWTSHIEALPSETSVLNKAGPGLGTLHESQSTRPRPSTNPESLRGSPSRGLAPSPRPRRPKSSPSQGHAHPRLGLAPSVHSVSRPRLCQVF